MNDTNLFQAKFFPTNKTSKSSVTFFLLLCTTLFGINTAHSQDTFSEEQVENNSNISSEAANIAINSEGDSNLEEQFSLEDLRLFAHFFEQIKHNYIEDISDAELLELAIKGMLSQLDPHSEFLDGEKREHLENSTKGSFVGLGLELTMEEGDLLVVSPLDGSPAKRADIKSGDIILRIDNQTIFGMSLSQALDLMDANQNTLTLLISREDISSPFEVSLEREEIATSSVNTKTLTHDIGYIRISQFQQDTGAELKTNLAELLDETPYITGLILDLRNNPGGVLQAAIEVTDVFLDEGIIVSIKGRAEDSESAFHASPQTISATLPMVVLINRGSASSSEIVAGALQDHKRAIIMGDISFGKGSIQNIVAIDDKRSIKLTTARYYTPSGRSIQAQGVFPDISVLAGEIERKPNAFQINEEALLRHLENENIHGENGSTEPELLGMRETLSDIDDLQLAQAIGFLKGLALYQQ